MKYSEEQIDKLEDALHEIESEFRKILPQYIHYPFKNDVAKEYALHGLNRRLGFMLQCIKNVFKYCNPLATNRPSNEDLNNTVIAIQAFIANTAGCIDNIAWVWAKEKNISCEKSQEPLKKEQISLFNCKEIKKSFSDSFQKKLKSYENWNKNLKDYRDTLVHRIPLYIPEFSVDPKNKDKYNELETLSNIALYEELNIDKYKRLTAEQEQYKFFTPIMLHSWNETRNKVFFMPQLIADFRTILELAENLLKELKV